MSPHSRAAETNKRECGGPKTHALVRRISRRWPPVDACINIWGAISHKGLGPLVRIDERFTSAAYLHSARAPDDPLCVEWATPGWVLFFPAGLVSRSHIEGHGAPSERARGNATSVVREGCQHEHYRACLGPYESERLEVVPRIGELRPTMGSNRT